MAYRKWLVPFVSAISGWGLIGAAEPGAPSLFRTTAGMVLVPVTVTDHTGKTVTGLQREHFTILDEHVVQPIVSFAGEDSPSSVGLVLDVSGSMRNTLGDARTIVGAFLKTANPQDEFFLLTVSTKPETVSGFTSDVAALERTVPQTSSGGMTALIDTAYLGLSQMRHARSPRRAMLIVSDGLDNNSRYTKSELIRVALEADVQVYSVIVRDGATGLGEGFPVVSSMVAKPIDMARQNRGQYFLEELSEKTGGLHFRAGNAGEAQGAVRKASEAIRNIYVIGYEVPEADSSGKWHRIRVKTDVPHTTVSARNGYYAR